MKSENCPRPLALSLPYCHLTKEEGAAVPVVGRPLGGLLRVPMTAIPNHATPVFFPRGGSVFITNGLAWAATGTKTTALVPSPLTPPSRRQQAFFLSRELPRVLV